MSTKGQVVLPREIRERLRWPAGTELDVEERGDVVVLRKRHSEVEKRFTLADLVGCLPYSGPPVTQEMLGAAVDDALRERWTRKEKDSRS
jgi:AbrB family looped-hinge helix DNA binding protein